jgi:hypothetical protein
MSARRGDVTTSRFFFPGLHSPPRAPDETGDAAPTRLLGVLGRDARSWSLPRWRRCWATWMIGFPRTRRSSLRGVSSVGKARLRGRHTPVSSGSVLSTWPSLFHDKAQVAFARGPVSQPDRPARAGEAHTHLLAVELTGWEPGRCEWRGGGRRCGWRRWWWRRRWW